MQMHRNPSPLPSLVEHVVRFGENRRASFGKHEIAVVRSFSNCNRLSQTLYANTGQRHCLSADSVIAVDIWRLWCAQYVSKWSSRRLCSFILLPSYRYYSIVWFSCKRFDRTLIEKFFYFEPQHDVNLTIMIQTEDILDTSRQLIFFFYRTNSLPSRMVKQRQRILVQKKTY